MQSEQTRQNTNGINHRLYSFASTCYEYGVWFGAPIVTLFCGVTPSAFNHAPSSFRPIKCAQTENIANGFTVTKEMVPEFAILGVSPDLNTIMTLEEIHYHYKQKARKLHPDRNKSANAHAEFLELQSAYETLKTLIQKQLDPLGLSAELTAYFNAMDEELNQLQQGYKDLGQTITRYNQNADKFIEGVNRLNQRTEEVLQLSHEYSLNVQEFAEKTNQFVARADQCIARADQYIARAAQNSAMVKENAEKLDVLIAQIATFKREEAKEEERSKANQHAFSAIDADLDELLQSLNQGGNNQHTTNPHRFMASIKLEASEDAVQIDSILTTMENNHARP